MKNTTQLEDIVELSKKFSIEIEDTLFKYCYCRRIGLQHKPSIQYLHMRYDGTLHHIRQSGETKSRYI